MRCVRKIPNGTRVPATVTITRNSVDLIQRVASPRVFENRFCQGLSSSLIWIMRFSMSPSPDGSTRPDKWNAWSSSAAASSLARKALIQADDAGDVIRVGPAFQEAGPDGRIVRSRFFKLEPGPLETQGHHDRRPIAEEIGLGFGLGETQQVEDRFLLVLRPQALAFDVRPARCEDVDTDYGKPDQHRDDRQERRNDQEHALARCEPLSGFCDRTHKGLDINVGQDSLHVLPFFPRNF